ncbi:MAG: hypothetical protein E4G94_02050 [ANME-2 cluster archaeon]|nr:MAG: hypothetical protein E4G94_02050 [ANME-2 cluster archaeon]
MTEIFKKIDRNFMELLSKIMEEKLENYQNISFDEFIDKIGYEGKAKSIKTINQTITIRMNEVGPSNWYFKVRFRDKGQIVHISREKKNPYCLP